MLVWYESQSEAQSRQVTTLSTCTPGAASWGGVRGGDWGGARGGDWGCAASGCCWQGAVVLGRHKAGEADTEPR